MLKERVQALTRYKEIKKFFERYNHYFIPASLVIGVIFDYVTFQSIKVTTTLEILGIYLFVAASMIFFMNFFDERLREKSSVMLGYFRLLAPLLVQFTFGALLSSAFLFYWFSGSWLVSWPLLLALILLMVSNELLREQYARVVVQLSIYYFVLFSFSTFALPYLLNSLSRWTFLLGGFGSLAIMGIFLSLTKRFIFRVRTERRALVFSVMMIFFIMNFLYFSNLIPPIPLSLRDREIAHMIEKTGSDYLLSVEEQSWIQKILPGRTVHVTPGESLYLYTAIFAPGNLSTDIVHDWQWKNPETHDWETISDISFSMVGGRDAGYRGYTKKTITAMGDWRVNVETDRGQVLARVRFHIDEPHDSMQFKTLIK
jgi:hypothetical protein